MPASGPSAASSVVSMPDSGSQAPWRSPNPARTPRARTPIEGARPQFAVRVFAGGQVDRDLQPFPKTPSRLERTAQRARKPMGIESQETDAAGSNRALSGVDPAHRRCRRKRIEVVHDQDQPIRRRSSPPRRAPNPCGSTRPEFAARRPPAWPASRNSARGRASTSCRRRAGSPRRRGRPQPPPRRSGRPRAD